MKIFEAYISPISRKFIEQKLTANLSLSDANILFHSVSGIASFFETATDLEELKEKLLSTSNILKEPDRTEYGDFQTNSHLAITVAKYLSKKGNEPDVVIEPTCGKGNFIVAALKTFKTLKKVYGIEIYRPYVWETKFSILDFYIENPSTNKPIILISHYNVFDFDFKAIASEVSGQNILVIGNPPWVTNSMLGGLNSSNLPAKSNFKKHNGLDSITGKGNFDIAEYITMIMLETFQNQNGNIALLVKNSVIKNIIFDQKKNKYKIGNIEKHCIDSKKEFNVSVDAALFLGQLNASPSFKCNEFDFYKNSKPLLSFGWVEEKFVSNIKTYVHSKDIDGDCPFEWRQGLKHDCSTIMEFDKVNGHYLNSLNEETELESDLVYGILKSSDLKNSIVKKSRKYTIVTQRKVGQETSYIRSAYPKTYQYLLNHQSSFDARKSSIYKGKPSFSIFGIGDYSFKPFKVVISGLYKTYHFTLVLPDKKKPLMLDDTCYMLGFDKLDYAVYTLILLNSQQTKELLQSVTFPDAKRTFTKDVLMRIDLSKLSNQLSLDKLQYEIEKLNTQYSLNASIDNWNSFIDQLRPAVSGQTTMFV
ncbi:hypothetical protein [Ferruginibacter sp. HRS2-29]|uniref:hypothetical protein n=1 Tax=Ferruginibacter sp. HRS2-29 TaxID=2487334 RepID=UPI0020CC06D8|nr:hypothetical protein [Ferruginibacter sp. HRS2-29]MCP9753248.1 hypothetical protein [Ferruginibacter sp. HRS2-29]